MITTCPKCQYERSPMDAQVNKLVCPACGIVYSKWLARQQDAEVPDTSAYSETPRDNRQSADTFHESDEEARETLREFISYVPRNIDPAVFWGRALTFIGFVLWSFYFISAGVNWEQIGGSFLHNVNLPFHEFGHVFFSPLGEFMTILGGSLFQVIMPLGLMGVFMWKQRDNFAASIMLWWSGQNFIDVSPYIDDAQYRMLPLVGGRGEESHDWGNLLTMMNLLEKTHKISHACFAIGAVIIFIALCWAAYILLLQKKNLLQQ